MTASSPATVNSSPLPAVFLGRQILWADEQDPEDDSDDDQAHFRAILIKETELRNLQSPKPSRFAPDHADEVATVVTLLLLVGLALLGMLQLLGKHIRAHTFAHYQSMLPAGLEIASVDLYRTRSPLDLEACGGVFLRLKTETTDSIKREGLRFFESLRYARKYPKGTYYYSHYTYRPWQETPMPEDVRNRLEWSKALDCMRLDPDERRKLNEVVQAPGSYWSTKHQAVMVVVPRLNRVILTYFET